MTPNLDCVHHRLGCGRDPTCRRLSLVDPIRWVAALLYTAGLLQGSGSSDLLRLWQTVAEMGR
jgi:hypothetical protein